MHFKFSSGHIYKIGDFGESVTQPSTWTWFLHFQDGRNLHWYPGPWKVITMSLWLKKKNQICACRFPYHLIKYKKNNPDYLKNLAICPFSAYHQVPLAEIRHMSSCDDKSCIEQDVVIQEPWTRDSDRDHITGALLTMNTGIKVCRNRPAPHLSAGTANYCGNHSPASQATSLWSLRVTWLQACKFPSLCHGKTMEFQ